MMANQLHPDRAERLTVTGIFILRLAGGLFFLIPGLSKFLAPDDAIMALGRFPEFLEPHLPLLYQIVAWAEVIGGVALILGFNLRVVIAPLVIIILGASLFVIGYDDTSSIRTLSLLTHIMAVGLYGSLFFLGSGRWSLDRDRDLIWLISHLPLGRLSAAARDLTTGWGKNSGIFLLRVSVAFPFLAAAGLALTGQEYNWVMPDQPWAYVLLLASVLVGGVSIMTGFRVKELAWLLIALTLVHLIAVAIPDAKTAHNGLVNILFHFLLIAALYALRLIRLGSDLEVGHILRTDRKNIVVIGGGFAGTELVCRLEKKLPNTYRVVLISEENYQVFNPLLAEIVGATILPAQTVAPIRLMIRRTQFILGTVTEVDFQSREIRYRNDDHTGTVPYEHVVFALGARANLKLVPGMPEYALPFKLLGDALALRNRVIEQMEKADQTVDREQRHWLGHFIVIGGGFSGVEVAGAIHDYIRSSHKHYPRLHDANLRVTVLHGSACVLPEFRPALGRYAARTMQESGIDVRLNARVGQIDANGVILKDGTRIDGGTIVSTIGTTANPLTEKLNLPMERGQIQVRPDLSVEGFENVWAVGDCALMPNAYDGSFSPPTAQFAIRAGHHLAHNIQRAVRRRKGRPFSHRLRGTMVSIGALRSIVDIPGLGGITGFAAWLMWRAYYLSLMPTVLRRVQIFFNWTWAMLFSADITNLRFTTSRSVDDLDDS